MTILLALLLGLVSGLAVGFVLGFFSAAHLMASEAVQKRIDERFDASRREGGRVRPADGVLFDLSRQDRRRLRRRGVEPRRSMTRRLKREQRRRNLAERTVR